MKKIGVLILSLLMGLLCFAACAPRDTDNYGPDGMMELAVWGGDEYVGSTGDKMKAFIQSFNASDAAKALKVRLTFQSMSQLVSQMGGSALSGEIPDILIWDRFSTPSNNNLLVDITDMAAKDGIDLTKFQSEALKEISYEGRVYGLPMDLDPWGIYINLDIVNEYNASALEADKIDVEDLGTWSKLMDAAIKLTKYDEKGNITRSGLNTTSMDGQFFSFVYTGAGELINTDKSSPSYGDTTLVASSEMTKDANSKRVYDVLSYFKDLYNKKVCATGHGGTDAFVNNLLAMTYGSIYFKQNIQDVTDKEMNMKMIPFPQRDLSYTGAGSSPVNPEEQSNGLVNGQYSGMLGGYGLAIAQPAAPFRNARWKERVEKAWEVIKLWMMDDEMQRMFYTTTEQITARMDLHSDAYYQQAGSMKDILPYLANYRIRPNVEGYEQFETLVVRSEIQAMYEGNTALTIYNNIRDKGNQMLRDYQGR